MNFDKINREIKDSEITLKPISISDRDFIQSLFQDSDISKYYIVPKEAQQDHRKLINYWLSDVNNGAGTCWIIIKTNNGLFSSNKEVGFVAFEFRDNLTNARISYAIHPDFRKKGIATKSVELVIKRLEEQGVLTIEADIDRDNVNSEKVVEKLGFTADKRKALFDPEMLREGEVRIRALWKKVFRTNDTTILGISFNIQKIPLDANIEQIIPIINDVADGINKHGQRPELLTRYFYLLGRVRFLEGNFEESKQAFANCNTVVMNEGLPEMHETFYWFGRINAENGDLDNAKMYYGFALENFNGDPNYITREEIEKAMRM